VLLLEALEPGIDLRQPHFLFLEELCLLLVLQHPLLELVSLHFQIDG